MTLLRNANSALLTEIESWRDGVLDTMAKSCNLIGTKYEHFNNCRSAIKKAILEYGDICYLCGFQIQHNDVNLDHVVPVVLGGSHDLSNWRATHPICNTRKGDMTTEDYYNNFPAYRDHYARR